MSDKERILMTIINRFIPYLSISYDSTEPLAESSIFNTTKLKNGDLVVAQTAIHINPFCVGYVEDVNEKDGYVLIREIGSTKLCKYYNESFICLNKDKLGYEILEGTQYITYQKVLKAFDYTGYYVRFMSISFDKNICTVKAREAYENDEIFSISFKYNSKTSIKSIADMLIDAENEWKDNIKK